MGVYKVELVCMRKVSNGKLVSISLKFNFYLIRTKGFCSAFLYL